jgi:pullulanase/glycogen debranching enzyme
LRRRTLRTGPGEPLPLGLTRVGEGFNLAVFSRQATGVSVLIFSGHAVHEQTALDYCILVSRSSVVLTYS